MRDYYRRQTTHRRQKEERVREVREKLPRIREIDDEIASASVQCARKLLSGGGSSLSALKEHIALLGQERREVLLAGGFPEDYLELTYDCPDCRDSGYVNGQKCHCFQKAEIDLLYTQSNLCGILEKENFQTFSFDYYSDELKEELSGVSSLERMKKVYAACRQFVRDFDTADANLFFYGDTGVGKTFLSHCIAKELLDTTHSVVYFSAQELFELIAQKRFEKTEQTEGILDAVYGCDLLIIDDLGTELTNTFVNSELFLCINERLTARKSTIISTNLSLKAFKDTYSERIFSRISTSYTMLKLFGKDIRLLKKMARNRPV
ncbi:DNA replication protein DnaC [Marvinbryantia formatexigens DSM 14469]|uniref:DNA replication protein DnaC n=2 Tax=Marvinbryantia TaxID=248744 RepID=C6L9H9_9FIRM|nr:DNA replication protein DnaC [Marvinbryantia formatexigens DSM 14469]